MCALIESTSKLKVRGVRNTGLVMATGGADKKTEKVRVFLSTF